MAVARGNLASFDTTPLHDVQFPSRRVCHARRLTTNIYIVKEHSGLPRPVGRPQGMRPNHTVSTTLQNEHLFADHFFMIFQVGDCLLDLAQFDLKLCRLPFMLFGTGLQVLDAILTIDHCLDLFGSNPGVFGPILEIVDTNLWFILLLLDVLYRRLYTIQLCKQILIAAGLVLTCSPAQMVLLSRVI